MRLKEKAKKKKGRGFGADSIHRETIDYESVRDDTNEDTEPGMKQLRSRLSVSFWLFFFQNYDPVDKK